MGEASTDQAAREKDTRIQVHIASRHLFFFFFIYFFI